MTLAQTLAEHWVLILVLFSLVWSPLVWNIIKHTRAYRKQVKDLADNEAERKAEYEGELWKPIRHTPLPQACLECPVQCPGCGAPPWADHPSYCEGEESPQHGEYRGLSQADLETRTAAVERGCCPTCGAPPGCLHVQGCGD